MKHLLSYFEYCPHCGSPDFKEHDAFSKRCAACGFTLYHNASAAVAAVVVNARGELLVCRRALEPKRGMLDLPGGFVEPRETAENALRREMREETGADVANAKFLFSLPNVYEYSGFEVHTIDLFFRAEIPDETAIFASDDAAELFWIPMAEVRVDDFAFASAREALRRVLAEEV